MLSKLFVRVGLLLLLAQAIASLLNMNDIVRFSGGATIGQVRISLSAMLLVTHEKITLQVFPFCKYVFYRNAVVSIEEKNNSRIIIHHMIPHYPERIVFGTSNAREKIQKIKRVRFFPAAQLLPGMSLKRKGWPVRWQVLLLALAWWNGVPFLAIKYPEINAIAPFSLIAISGTFLGCIATLSSSRFQKIVVSPSRHIGEVSLILSLLSFITGIFSVVMSLQLIFDRVQSFI